MLAQLYVQLSFVLVVPEGVGFPVYEYTDQGYTVRAMPPGKSDSDKIFQDLDGLQINGQAAYQADVLNLIFAKEEFNRAAGALCDPPESVIQQALDSFLARLRFVTKAPQIRPVKFPAIPWRLNYLNDDGSALPEEKDKVRGRGSYVFSFQLLALDQQIWEKIHELPADFRAPPWEDLLLDAQAELPAIGPALVLAATSVEVFIAHVLDQLVVRTPIPSPLWNWINDRDQWLQEPSVEEQMDTLLLIIAGHSLKEDLPLWEAFKNLKTARNGFVHSGVACVGGKPVDLNTAMKLVAGARSVIDRVHDWLPKELQWPHYDLGVAVTATHKVKMEK